MVGAIFIGTFLPLVLLMFLLRHSRPVFSCFCWGMLAFLLVNLSSGPIHEFLGLSRELRISAVYFGPPFEELMKIVPVLIAMRVTERSFVPFYYILAMTSGIGFSVEENLNYLVAFHQTDAQSMALMVLRSFSTCIMHGVATGLFGFSLTMARRGGGIWYAVFPLLGWMIASLYHGVFNWLVIHEHLTIAVILAFSMFFGFLVGMKKLEPKAMETRGTPWQ